MLKRSDNSDFGFPKSSETLSKKAIVIGAGFGGLAAAMRMGSKGYKVSVFDKLNNLGGRGSSLNQNGYRFDSGPSLFTMPQWVLDLFKLAKEDPEDHFKYKSKEVACHYFWEDHTRFSASSDRDEFISSASKTFNEPPQKILNYLTRAEKKFNLTRSLFLEQSLHKLDTFLSLDTLKALAHLNTYELDKTLHNVNQNNFKNPKLIQLFDRFATYNGSNPYETSGIMTLIQHLEQHYGTYIPEGGMHQITLSLFDLAKRLGVLFNFETRVDQILTKDSVVEGVRADKEIFPAKLVVSNMDVVPTYSKSVSYTHLTLPTKRIV